eukprot:Gb_15285 [translate_table: standard]
MAGLLPGDPSQLGITESGTFTLSHEKLEEPDHSSSNWYFGRQEIEENSPSRKDGIDLKKESYFRKSYCTFLQDLGMRLKVPQVTIATAIIFCHRFFLRQSHSKNDRRTIATVCMFLAGKVEETPRPLRDVILVSYEICNKKDPAAIQRIKQKEVYEQQKELVLLGERVVLATLGFDLNVHHPYKPLVAAIKKFKVAQNALAQVAWNFVNDGLRTSLCLQFKPHHIAAGAIFLAAKFLKVKLPSDGEKVWWQEFEVTPRQLEEVSNQMLELYEQNRAVPASRGGELDGSVGASNRQKPGNSEFEDPPSANGHSEVPLSSADVQHVSGLLPADTSRAFKRDAITDPENCGKYVANATYMKQNMVSVNPDTEQAYSENQGFAEENLNTNQPNTLTKEGDQDHPTYAEVKDDSKQDLDPSFIGRGREKIDEPKLNKTKPSAEWPLYTPDGFETKEQPDSRRDANGREDDEPHDKRSGDEIKSGPGSNDIEWNKTYVGLNVIDKDRVKAALEKRRKSRGEVTDSRPTVRKADLIDEDDLIERELESGVEAAAEAERAKQERKDSWSKSLQKPEQEGSVFRKDHIDEGENVGKRKRPNEESSCERRRSRSFDPADPASQDQEQEPAESLYDRIEEGELPNSTVHEQVHSPKHAERRSHISTQLEKGASPINHRDYGGRDQHGHKDGLHDTKYRLSYPHQHSYHQQHQHRVDADRDRHHTKERDHKRIRHDHAK